MKKTAHFILRQQQRSLGNKEIELVYEHGDLVGSDLIYMTKGSYCELQSDLKLQLNESMCQLKSESSKENRRKILSIISNIKREMRCADRARNIKVVEEDGALVTCMRPSGKGLESLRKKMRKERIH